MLSEFLTQLFIKYKDRNIEYCILRNYEELPEVNNSHDVDFLIHKSDADKNAEYLMQICHSLELTCIRVVKKEYVENWFFASQQHPLDGMVQLDFFYDGEWHGFQYLSADEILQQRVQYKDFYVPCKNHEALLTLYSGLLWGGIIKEKYYERLCSLIKSDKEGFDHIIINTLGEKEAWISDELLSGHCDKIVSSLSVLRSSLKRQCFKKSPLGTIKQRVTYILYELRARFVTPGREFVYFSSDGFDEKKLNNSIEPFFKAPSAIEKRSCGFKDITHSWLMRAKKIAIIRASLVEINDAKIENEPHDLIAFIKRNMALCAGNRIYIKLCDQDQDDVIEIFGKNRVLFLGEQSNNEAGIARAIIHAMEERR